MHEHYINAASQPFHSNSVQASIGAMLGSIAAYVKTLDYEFISCVTAIITLVYIIFAFSMAIERRLKQTRFVSSDELESFKKWKREKLIKELDDENGADTHAD